MCNKFKYQIAQLSRIRARLTTNCQKKHDSPPDVRKATR